jgi:hypothetical protein
MGESIGTILGQSFGFIAIPLAIILGIKERSVLVGIISFFILPYFFLLLIFTLGLGCVVGLPVGIFYSIRNYMFSIHDNITNKVFKIIMIIITWLIIIMFLLNIAYHIYRYFN